MKSSASRATSTSVSVHSVSPEYAMVFPSISRRRANGGAPLAWTTSNGMAEMPPIAACCRSCHSREWISYFCWVCEDPANNASCACRTLALMPGGPAMSSGRSRFDRNWPSRMKKGMPPKWSPCRCETRIASISFGSTLKWRMATSDEAPQSSRTLEVAERTWMQAWKRPPLPNASPEPRKRTVTGVTSIAVSLTRHPLLWEAMSGVNIARLRLRNQQIAQQDFRTPAEVVAYLGALQAQDFAGGKWAIGLRLPNASEADIEGAVADRTIVRTWPMRGTLHFVPAADVRWMLALMASRVVAGSAGRYRSLGLDERTLERGGEALAIALAGRRSLTRPELYRVLDEAGIRSADGRGLHIIAHHAQTGLVCFASHAGKQPTFVLLDERVPPATMLDRDEALAELAKRYFTSHGPASLQDFAWWSGLPLRDVRAGAELAALHIDRMRINGVE